MKICIMICTCDRPLGLRRLLVALMPQADAMNAAIVIADNGLFSSIEVVRDFHRRDDLILSHEKIALAGLVPARNGALRMAMELDPDYLVFIDDDEWPGPDWLKTLCASLDAGGADFASGPVVPAYETEPADWMVTGQYFYAQAGQFRTSNLILRTRCLPAEQARWFHPAFSFSGGEDLEFLDRLVQAGAVQAPAECAIVHEFVPRTRMNRRYLLFRGFRDGVVLAQIAALRARNLPAFWGRLSVLIVQKLGYALNHFSWSVFQGWRFQKAAMDLACVAGLLARALGMRFSFYGLRPERNFTAS